MILYFQSRIPVYVAQHPAGTSVQNFIHAAQVLLDFSLTVKAATLIFISGRGSTISSAKEGKSGFIYNLVKLRRANVHAFHENPNRIHTELTFINP